MAYTLDQGVSISTDKTVLKDNRMLKEWKVVNNFKVSVNNLITLYTSLAVSVFLEIWGEILKAAEVNNLSLLISTH